MRSRLSRGRARLAALTQGRGCCLTILPIPRSWPGRRPVSWTITGPTARSCTQIVTPLEDMFWGDRRYEALDLEGHRWHFAERLSEIRP